MSMPCTGAAAAAVAAATRSLYNDLFSEGPQNEILHFDFNSPKRIFSVDFRRDKISAPKRL